MAARRTKVSTEIVLYDLRIVEAEGGRKLPADVTLATLLRSTLLDLSKQNNLLLGRRTFGRSGESAQQNLFDEPALAFMAHPNGDALSISVSDFQVLPTMDDPQKFLLLFKLIDPTATDPAFADRRRGTFGRTKMKRRRFPVTSSCIAMRHDQPEWSWNQALASPHLRSATGGWPPLTQSESSRLAQGNSQR